MKRTCLGTRSKKSLIAQVGGSNEDLTPILQHAQSHQVPYLFASVSPTLGALKCAYAEFQNLGIDRWLTVVASFHLFPNQACVIVDSGTATKVDVLDASGQHQGGWILPGLDMMIDSLVANTQKVFSDTHTLFDTKLGTNTPNAVKNAALECDCCTCRACSERKWAKTYSSFMRVDMASLFSNTLILTGIYFDDLVMQGLIYWRKYQQND